jgi:sigma-B regulation protein RsbU (phosphoserine phosphatase)
MRNEITPMSSNEETHDPLESVQRNSAASTSASHFSKTFNTLSPELHFGELGRRLVEVAQTLPCVLGVRLWRVLDGEASVFHQSGTVSLPSKAIIDGICKTGSRGPEGLSQSIYPIKVGSAVVGALEIQSGNVLTETIDRSLEKLVYIIEVGLNHLQQEQVAQELSAVLEATKLLNSTIDLSETINIILQLATHLCKADRGTVFLVDQKRNEIWSLRGLGLEEHEIRLPIDRGIAGWVASHGIPVIISDARSDSRFDPQVDHDLGYHTRDLLAFPVRNKSGDIVGVIELLNKETGCFTDADESSLGYLSDHVAVALENARLHRELLAKQRLESDLALARNVQRGLLPEQPPMLERFEIGVAYTPSLMVGGDYYDFLKLKPSSLLAVIADVEGKSVASALMMAHLHAALHTMVAHIHALEDIAGAVNDMILSDSRTRKLMSMFLAVIQDRERVLHYINAGHVLPVVLRKDGEIVLLSEGGMVLGVLPDIPFKRGRIELVPGDIVAAYTDGITEAMDDNGEQYGLERLIEMVRLKQNAPASEIVEAILADVAHFSDGGLHEDDCVMLILKVS